MARIIDNTILVQKNSPNQSAELDQRVPVAAIAGQARRLDCEHERQHAPRRSPPEGASKPVVDWLAPPELAKIIASSITSDRRLPNRADARARCQGHHVADGFPDCV